MQSFKEFLQEKKETVEHVVHDYKTEKAFESFYRPAYYGTLAQCSERRDCGEKM